MADAYIPVPSGSDPGTPVPSPEHFLTVAQGARANEQRYAESDEENGQQQAHMWGTIARLLESAAVASATVPPQVVHIVAAAAALVQDASAEQIRRARRDREGVVMNRRAQVGYPFLVALVDTIEETFPELLDGMGVEVRP